MSQTPEEIAAYKEKLNSISFGRVPGGTREGKFAFRDKPNMSWEKSIQGERRPDGSFMPYVRESDLSPITAKMRANMGSDFDRQVGDIRRGVDQPSKE